MKKLVLLFISFLLFGFLCQAQTITDADGNSYDTVVIGSKIWLKQNLRTTHYNNGDLIPVVSNDSTWGSLHTGARCYYNNDSVTFDSVYGPLYNWYAVDNDNGICPLGFHVSSNADWITTENYLGGASIAGGKMKEEGFEHWSSPNTDASNSTHFIGLPGGFRGLDNAFITLHENGLFWQSTQYNAAGAQSCYFWYLFAGVDHNPAPKYLGMSVRCVKENSVGMNEISPVNTITIYPNPSQNSITVEIPDNQYSTLQIFNLLGELQMESAIISGVNKLDISNIPSGIYMVKCFGSQNIFQQKLVKQ